jgi:hypothetical protein
MNSIPMINPAIAMARQDRRRSVRVKTALQVELRAQGSDVPIRVQTADVSIGGFYVEMSVTLPLGTPVDVVLWLGDKKLRGNGVVATCHPQFGNGVDLQLSEEDQTTLGLFLDSILQPERAQLVQ